MASTHERIESMIPKDGTLLFMKGDRSQPQCGFSAKVVQMLDSLIPEYGTFDVLSDADVREGIKEYSSWPTIPQLYVNGEFVGGCDIVTEMYANGELHELFGMKAPERKIPKITVTEAAAESLRGHLANAPDETFLSLAIDAAFETQLGLRPRTGNEVEVETNGVLILMDVMTAEKAEGVTIDLVESLGGASFKVDNPNAPQPVKQLMPGDIKKMIDAGEAFEFFDVRTPEERETAQIAGTRLLDEETAKYIEGLPRETTLVFHCHHGGRSQQAAEHFRRRGFTDVINMAGGIEAWSQEVDSSVPRY